jgi:acyl-coenzyme A thioesterase PaaI-like protein
MQLSANLIRNTGAGTVTAEARLVHRGRTTMVAQTSVRPCASRTLVIVTTTHLVLSGAGGR